MDELIGATEHRAYLEGRIRQLEMERYAQGVLRDEAAADPHVKDLSATDNAIESLDARLGVLHDRLAALPSGDSDDDGAGGAEPTARPAAPADDGA